MVYQSIIRDPGGSAGVRMINSTMIVDGSILLVAPNTQAFFVCNGVVSEPYPAGRWEIRTGVSPFFVKFRNLMTKGNPGISCQVWFVNTVQENCKTGGTGEILFQEKRFKVSMGAYASYTMRYVIAEPLIFISKIVGMHHSAISEESIQPAIESMVIPVVKDAVAGYMSSHSIHEFQSNLESIGAQIQMQIRNQLRVYGLDVKAVAIKSINVKEEDRQRLNTLEQKVAVGTIETDLEVDNIKRVYGNVENRTMTEVVTGSLRGPAKPTTQSNTGMGGIAGNLAALPMQIAIANRVLDHLPTVLGATQNGGADAHAVGRICPDCRRRVDAGDGFCRYCGRELNHTNN